jgi:hypothetical protein
MIYVYIVYLCFSFIGIRAKGFLLRVFEALEDLREKNFFFFSPLLAIMAILGSHRWRLSSELPTTPLVLMDSSQPLESIATNLA